jgi:maltose/maltodextrin transport system permease protein
MNKLIRRLAILAFVCVILFPMAIVAIVSVNKMGSLSGGFDITQLTWDHWRYVFGLPIQDPLTGEWQPPEFPILRWFSNSLLVASVSATLILTLSALAAYALSRFQFRGRFLTLNSLLIVQLFPSAMAIIAVYKMLEEIGGIVPSLGTDSLGGLVLIYLGATPFNIWLLKGYFDTLPKSIEEAAVLDGCSPLKAFTHIVLPLSAPILAVVWLLAFIATFNDFIGPSVLLKTQSNLTFAVGIQIFVADAFASRWGQFAAACLFGATPVVIAFLWVHRYLISGLSAGAVK